jgi:hypothetical protein
MILLVVILSASALLAVTVLGVSEAHTRISRLFEHLRNGPAEEVREESRSAPDCTLIGSDPFPELSFTRSLLALSKVRSPAPDSSPEHAPAEPSSLALVPHAQLKSRDQAL